MVDTYAMNAVRIYSNCAFQAYINHRTKKVPFIYSLRSAWFFFFLRAINAIKNRNRSLQVLMLIFDQTTIRMYRAMAISNSNCWIYLQSSIDGSDVHSCKTKKLILSMKDEWNK